MKKPLHLVNITITLLSIFFYGVANASNGLYKVEVIVFEHITPQNVAEETWPLHPALPNVDNAITLKPYQPGEPIQAYQLLPHSKLSLMSEQYALQNRGGYNILLHLAWLQPAANIWQAKAVHIYAQPLAGQNYKLNGTIKVSSSNYIDVETNITLNIPKQELLQFDPQQFKRWPASLALASFRLNETRRLRSQELHYLDHPLYGMLIRVTPD